MFKVLAYDADGFGWFCVSKHNNREQARAAAFLVKQERAYQWVALVQVRILVSDGASEIDVLDCNAPRAENLPTLQQFREAATAK